MLVRPLNRIEAVAHGVIISGVLAVVSARLGSLHLVRDIAATSAALPHVIKLTPKGGQSGVAHMMLDAFCIAFRYFFIDPEALKKRNDNPVATSTGLRQFLTCIG